MNNAKSKSSSKSSDSSAPLMSKVKYEQVKEDNHASISETQSHSLSSDLNGMTMSGNSENSKNPNKEKAVPRSQYKPEKWMLLDQAEDRLSQLNLAIVSLPHYNFINMIY